MVEVTFEENPDGENQLLHSDGVRSMLAGYVTPIAERCNATLTNGDDDLGYLGAVDDMPTALVGHVWAAGAYATNSNAKYLTLILELGNG